MTTWKSLPAEEQLTYLVGLIVRSAVDLDAMTRTAYASIVGSDPSVAWDAPKNMRPRVERMRSKLLNTGLTRAEAATVGDALGSVLEIYQERNRFVHDDLMPAGDPDGKWWSMGGLHRTSPDERPPRSRVNLEMLHACERRLVRGTWRMWGLHKLLESLKANGEAYEHRRWLLLVNDDFDLHDRDDSISYSH